MNIFKRVFRRVYLKVLSRVNLLQYNKTRYYYSLGRKLNVKNPQTLDEKIVYMSFNSDISLWAECADKIKVRDYVTNHGFGYMLNELYGVYDKPEQINYDQLPDKFVIKTNHASGTNIIVKDKSLINKAEINKQLNEWLKTDYSRKSGDPHYSMIQPRILIEKFLNDYSGYNSETSLADYKFFCINGEPVCVEMMTDRANHSHKRRFYDMDWKVRDEWMLEGYPVAEVAEKPEPFDEMRKAAKELSVDFCFVRVDFYIINGKPIFGELTFTPGATECSQKFQEDMGRKMIIK